MFNELYQLALATPLMMTISASAEAGTLTLNVIPTPKKGDKGGEVEPALTKKLSLTATPEEFEQGFPQCLGGYTEKYMSLQEQVEATAAVLDAAKTAQVQRATTAVTKHTNQSAPKPTATPGVSTVADPNNSEDEGEETGAATEKSGEPSLFD